jgi:hypothetical protein
MPDSIVPIELTPREQRLINALAARFQSSERMPEFIRIDEIKRETDETITDIENLVDKFVRLQLVEWHGNNTLRILPAILLPSHQIRNPPTPNYLTEITKWWFSSMWRALIAVFIILLPLIVQWIEMIQACVGYLSWYLESRT